MAEECFKLLLSQDRWTFRVAHYAPWLFHWWMNQKLFPSLSMMAGKLDIFSQSDLEYIKSLPPNSDDNPVNNNHYLILFTNLEHIMREVLGTNIYPFKLYLDGCSETRSLLVLEIISS